MFKLLTPARSESDDEGVDWRAAGEVSGHWSDEEDERLAQASLMGAY
jgi:hypothetical protein